MKLPEAAGLALATIARACRESAARQSRPCTAAPPDFHMTGRGSML